MSDAPARRGRRPGSPDTRAAILAAARELFAAQGYAATSVRAVAAAAGVDKGTVAHHVGSKEDLFIAALQLPVDPRLVAERVAGPGVDGMGERLLRVLMEVWGEEAGRAALLGIVRGIAEPEGQRLVRDVFLGLLLHRVVERMRADREVDQAERRVTHVASQVVGLVMLRYVLEVEPLASLPTEQVVATYAPVLQGYLVDPLP